MARERRYRVKDLARMTGVSVRTLHHYDAIGLLPPSSRSAAGYRQYDDHDLLRLQSILIARELGLPLEAIRRSLDDPSYDRVAALEAQRAALLERGERTAQMIRAVDAALAALRGERTMEEMTKDEVAAMFDGFDPSAHEAEAEARWGDTTAYRESARRTRDYTEADWARYREESDAILRDAAALAKQGAATDGEPAMEVAERHRASIDRWFYPCDRAMHAQLADLYEGDPRFAATIDAFGEGLTAWLTSAIRANAAR